MAWECVYGENEGWNQYVFIDLEWGPAFNARYNHGRFYINAILIHYLYVCNVRC